VDWLNDHLVAVSAIALGVLTVPPLVWATVRGLRLFRLVKREQRRVDGPAAMLQASVEQAQRAAEHVSALGAERQEELERLKAEVARLGILARHAALAQRIIRAPLRYVGF
jgi:hypothetical protein